MRLSIVLMAVVITCPAEGPALAQQQTFDHLHAQARVGNQICMTTHWHFGEGGPFRVRSVAEQQATKRWSEFTIMEYGSQWG